MSATSKCNKESFRLVCQLWSVTPNHMRECKPQRCVQPHKSLKMTQNATN